MTGVAAVDTAPVRAARLRRGYIDWLRGIAILIMVEAHTIDSWTRASDRNTVWFGRGQLLGGFAAPLFLFLAGVAVALSASAKAGKSDVRTAARMVRYRGWQILLCAWLFRLQAMVLSHGAPGGLLKVDILNIMGPSIVVAAALWGAVQSTGARVFAFVVATTLLSVLTPAVRAATWLAPLPDPIEGYIRPVGALTNFCIFPWAGFVTAGALIGVLLDRARTSLEERRLHMTLIPAGASLALGGYVGSLLPPLFEKADFWTSSPAFFLLRTGILVCAIGVAYAWEHWAGEGWSPMRQFGRSSLFVYWIHVEMVYGPLSRLIQHDLSVVQWAIAYALFALLLLTLTNLKNDLVFRWQHRTARTPRPAVRARSRHPA
jgi:uncharacterized membrane protein